MQKTVIRKTLCIALAVTILSISVFALDEQLEAKDTMPRRTIGINNTTCLLTIDSAGIANCYGYIMLTYGYSIDATMTLRQAPYGSERWKDVKEWSASGSYPEVEIDKYRAVNSGYDYQLEIDIDIYNSSGRLVDSTTDYSDIVSY